MDLETLNGYVFRADYRIDAYRFLTAIEELHQRLAIAVDFKVTVMSGRLLPGVEVTFLSDMPTVDGFYSILSELHMDDDIIGKTLRAFPVGIRDVPVARLTDIPE